MMHAGFLQYGTYNIASNEAKSNYMPILPWVDTYVSHPAPTTQKGIIPSHWFIVSCLWVYELQF